jgi:hypothetical protein
LEGAHQRYAPGTQAPRAIGTIIVLSHNCLPCRPGGRTWFPGPVTLSSQDPGRLARERFVAAEKSLLDETRINDIARANGLVDPALSLVPGDLTVDVSDIELRLRIDKVGACLDCNRGAVSTIGIDIPGDGRRRFV